LLPQTQAFIALESHKISSHVDLVHNYTKEIKNEQAFDSQNKDLFNKINVLENDMQDQIVSWKHKHANIKEQNENEISDLTKK
jgi:ABC-type polar amino acid transport system ATPase subunit